MRVVVILACHLNNDSHVSCLTINGNGSCNCDSAKFSELVVALLINYFASFQNPRKRRKCLNLSLTVEIIHASIDLLLTKGYYAKPLSIYLKSRRL